MYGLVGYQNTFCRHPPAGLGRMVRGVDAAYLDLLPMDSDADMGFRLVIQKGITKSQFQDYLSICLSIDWSVS